jgi:UDP-N-acetylglucosamine diphosphorylase / glucose-1-phosphate thymidylyltransferase / UDP-N-acetylgalactosamine diphosphorylase / glucosamine-1-phosphate N-acetyltransferase / galactosamine-1-phosphate N-acetyltransferase
MKLTALILAGGVGKRLWPLTTDKALFDFAGRPVIDYVVDDLKTAGITDLVIVANPANQVQLAQLYPQAQITIQDQPSGMADAILTAQELISDPVLIINASDLLDPTACTDMVSTIDPARICLTGLKTSQFLHAGYFKLADSKPVAIIEKPTEADRPSDLVKLVMDYFPDPSMLFDQLKSDYEQSLNQILNSHECNLHIYTGRFNQLKYPWQVLAMMETILQTRFKPRRAADVVIHPTAVVEDNVILEPGVKVMPHATVAGPAYIGANTVIGNNALVRQSMIGADCVVGYNTEIARSWVGEKCWFHSNYIGDSVLEADISFGAGALTANFRLDQQPIKDTGRVKLGAIIGRGSRVGINASLMPGIKIGKQAVVGPGLVVKADLHDQQLYFK